MPGDPATADEVVQRAVDGERAGFRSGWLPQVSGLDALTVLALAAKETSTIELGTAVVPTYPRHPTVTAGQALTVQQVSNGRLALGIGLSHKMMIEDSLGLDYSRPVPHMREYLTVLNGLLAGERVSYSGELYRVNAQVGVANAPKPPLLVAALGPDMLKLCGRLADGTITWMGGIEYLRDVAVPALSNAASAAGKPAPRVVAMVPVLLTNDAAAGRDAINTAFAMYGRIPSYRATLDRGGAEVPADVAIVGDGTAIDAGLLAFEAAGVTDLVAVVPMAAPEAEATRELLGVRAKG